MTQTAPTRRFTGTAIDARTLARLHEVAAANNRSVAGELRTAIEQHLEREARDDDAPHPPTTTEGD